MRSKSLKLLIFFNGMLITQIITPVLGPQVDSCDLLSFLNENNINVEMESLKQEPFIAISLGENCDPAMHLKEHNIRSRSFPFDWNIIPFPSLYSLIENDFDGMINLSNLVISDSMVFNTRYQFKLAHDFDTDDWIDGPQGLTSKNNIGIEDYKRIESYYKRRIARFYLIFQLKIPIYLFRRVINSNEAVLLYQLLKSKFPHADFTLVCIQDNPWEEESHWNNMEGIVYHRMNQREAPTFTYEQQNKAWTDLFLKLGLI